MKGHSTSAFGEGMNNAFKSKWSGLKGIGILAGLIVASLIIYVIASYFFIKDSATQALEELLQNEDREKDLSLAEQNLKKINNDSEENIENFSNNASHNVLNHASNNALNHAFLRRGHSNKNPFYY